VCNLLNEERKILFVEYNIVPNLWKYIFWFEVSPKKVSSLSFKNIFEVLCVKICVWQQNGIEKYQAASITSLLNVIKNVKCSNLVNSCEISSTEIEPQWLCIMPSFNAIILHITIKLNMNIFIGTWAPPIIIFWEFYNNQHVIVTSPYKMTLSTLLLSLLVIPFIFILK